MFKISKIFNNNAVLAENAQGQEQVMLGKGLAFGKKIGDCVEQNAVEKTFSYNKSPFTERLNEILSDIPTEYFLLTNRIAQYAQEQFGKPLSNSLYATLTDHIYHAVERVKQQKPIDNSLSFEIQRLYRKEFEIGRYALGLIEQSLNVAMPEDEIGFIALHIFNARTDSENMSETYRTTQIIKDILNLVGYHFNCCLDENSLDYARFIAHLQYFALRLFKTAAAPLSSFVRTPGTILEIASIMTMDGSSPPEST